MNEPSTEAVAVETKPARKWTSEAGPIQTKKVFQAIKAIVQEGQTYSETWGIIGVSEQSMAFYSPFGGCRQDAKEALQKLGERFDYAITRQNYEQIIAAAYELVAVLKAERPVCKDTRKTAEQQAQLDRELAEASAARETEAARKQIADPELAEVWVNCVAEFRAEIKAKADKAAKTVTEVFAMWHKYSEACRASDQSAVMFEFEQLHKTELAPPVFIRVRHRGHLRELVEAGQVELVGSYHYDEMTGQSGFEGPPKPVRMCPDDRSQRQEGIVYVFSSDFEGKCGGMTQGKTGIVHLRVHSNSSYDFRIKPAAVSENGQNTPSALPQEAASSGSASGIVVRRNLEHNGVEVSFPSKPEAAVISRLKAAGFRWSMRSKVWYKKFGAEAWAQAHEIAGLPLALSGATVESEPDRSNLDYEDQCAEACGLNGQPE